MSTAVVRVPTEVHQEASKVAALRGQQAGQLLAEAWAEYFAKNREQFAADLEHAAQLLRNGTLDDLAAFTSRHVDDRAKAAAARARSKRKTS